MSLYLLSFSYTSFVFNVANIQFFTNQQTIKHKYRIDGRQFYFNVVHLSYKYFMIFKLIDSICLSSYKYKYRPLVRLSLFAL